MCCDHPKLEVASVSTDGLKRIEAVESALKQHGLENATSWIFADSVQRLRYAIDPNGYGVLPRSYPYDVNHERVAVTGGLERPQILTWLQYVEP